MPTQKEVGWKVRIHLLGLAIHADGLCIIPLIIECSGNVRVYYQRKRRQLLCPSHFWKGPVQLPRHLEVVSKPELVTSSNAKNSPIVILKGKWEVLGGSYQILKDKENTITVILRRTSKNDVQGQESDPGFYSPGDWGYAFGQTTTASFRAMVASPSGNLSGSWDQSPKKVWLWQ